MKGGLKIGQLARQAGVTAKAIRFYEAKRLLPRPLRGTNGYRLYGPDAVDADKCQAVGNEKGPTGPRPQEF
jgi:MerR family copper efflux transcriptional regulator